VFVCLSVCLVRSHVSLTTRSNFVKLSAHDASGRGSDLSWRRCDTLCTCGLVDDVVFHIVDPMAACRYCSSVTSACVHGLTFLRRGIVCVLSYTIVNTKTGRVFRARGAEGEICDAPLLCYFVPPQEECGSVVIVCLSVHSHNSTTTRPNFIKFVCLWPWIGYSVVALQYCMYCTSGFVDKVMALWPKR